jgi:uncharacterized protein YkwD
MSNSKSFPKRAARRSARLFFTFSLALAFLAVVSAESFAQSSGRPVARLITSSPRQAEVPQTQHRMVVRPVAAVRATSAPVAASSLERRAFDLINAERVKHGLAPLAWDGELCRVARQHSERMGSQNFFNHVAPDGSTLLDRARAGGLSWKSLGENIAFSQGYDDPAALAVDQWMHSPKHRANILRDLFTHSAIGISRTSDGRVYLTQVFMTR